MYCWTAPLGTVYMADVEQTVIDNFDLAVAQ
jgi:hypothetical protein